MKKNILFILIVLTLAVTPLCLQKAQAFTFGAGADKVEIKDPTSNPFGEGEEGVDALVTKIFDTAIIVGGILFTVLLLIGGILYLTAAGNEENTAKARKLLVEALIGLGIILAAWPVGRWIIDMLTG